MMDRRRFLQQSAILFAGSACGGTLAGCGTELNIPCLGPATAPVPVPGMTYIRASEIGCALDCNLQNGHNKYKGGRATDDAPKINAAMSSATASNPITLIIDGSAFISGLFLPAGGHWSIAGLGCGTGFFVKSGTNNDGIHNGPPGAAVPSDPGPPTPARGANVSLTNFTVNGNAGDGTSGDSTTGSRQGTGKTWYFGINLMNLDNIVVENVVVVETPAYHMRFSNVGNVSVSGCVMRSYGLSTDGLHFDGPANDITISDCNFTTGDDSIALNCPEGYSGNISRVSVTNCVFNSLSLMRLYTTVCRQRFYIDSVTVSGCSGTLSEAAFLIGLSNCSNANSVSGLTITDCSLTAPAILGMAENFGTIVLDNVTFNPSQADVYWVAPQANRICAFVRPSPLYGNITSLGTSLVFRNCTIHRTSDIQVAGVIVENSSTISTLALDGLAVQDAGSYSPLPALLQIGAGSIGQLVIDSLDTSNVKALIAQREYSRLGSICGNAVLATGWEFPDAVMADEVPYISASSGLPSIKVDGIVEPYANT